MNYVSQAAPFSSSLTRTSRTIVMTSSIPPSKRLRLDEETFHSKPDPALVRLQRSVFLASLGRPVSPPPRLSLASGNDSSIPTASSTPTYHEPSGVSPAEEGALSSQPPDHCHAEWRSSTKSVLLPKCYASPFQLTHIRDMPADHNRDTVAIKDLLGDVMIKEAWVFNFLFDVDWLLEQFDPDIRHLVSVKLVHGFWKRESENKIYIDEACARFPNVRSVTAYMPDPFGTHHTKMMVVFRYDDLAQVIIHTANMIPKDWNNMTQAVWRTPLLTQLPANTEDRTHYRHSDNLPPIGSGGRFKHDFLRYLKAYEKKTAALVSELSKYDFSAVRGALVGSVPSKINLKATSPEGPLWGWPALRRVLRLVPSDTPSAQPSTNQHNQSSTTRHPHIVCQVSSIATLSKAWIEDTFFSILATTSSSQTFKRAPRFSIVFPTAEEVRRSLDGYASGHSIHIRIQSAAQRKQLDILRPYLCRWGSSSHGGALRQLAAPHIKTYIRFSSLSETSIDWALLTSANLSTQAWGGVPATSNGEVRIQSYELGVLIWPELYADAEGAGKEAKMLPVLGTNDPSESDALETTLVGLRLPYDLPLTPYSQSDMPWCPHETYTEPDRHDRTWPPS